MNKTAIRNFAILARNKLIGEITYKAGLLGITDKGVRDPLPQSTNDVQFFDIGTKEPYAITGVEIMQRKKLVEVIQQKERQSNYKTAYKSVMEEVAYTWFNRLIAIRFMEVNDYLLTGIRVLSSASSSKIEPDLVTNPFAADLGYTPYETDRIMQLQQHNQLDELFRMLFIKQCNALNKVLPGLFEQTNDYTELLLNVSFTDQDGVVYHLVHDIPEEDFKQAVEIIGWLYQYYNEERRNEVINIYKGTVKKEDIPAATQLFTPAWVVQYMVDNSLGRYWLERNPRSALREKLQFFVAPKDRDITYIDEQVKLEDLTFFDPCMGSGHILVYAFDVFMEIYKECGYSERDAAVHILTNNLFGLDIDDRAYQLAYFALMMKARSYNRRFLALGLTPNVRAIQESNAISRFGCDNVTNDSELNKVGEYLVKTFKHAKEIGSILVVDKHDYGSFSQYLELSKAQAPKDLTSFAWLNNVYQLMQELTRQAAIMTQEYAIVCTNPPYLNKMEGNLKKFVTTKYKSYAGDLFSVFMYRNFFYCKQGGYSAFMTPFVWMFIKTYEDLRTHIINNKSITTLIQMEYSAFEEATVPICTFVLKNGRAEQDGLYIKLSDFRGGMDVQKRKVLEALRSETCSYFYSASTEHFPRIPNSPIAYHASEAIFSLFKKAEFISHYGETREGMATANNDIFLRYWFEPDFSRIGFGFSSRCDAKESGLRWFPYNKGGSYRKWYGNDEYLVDWENDGYRIRNFKDKATGRIRSHNYNLDYIFRKGLTWTALSSGNFGCRYSQSGKLADSKGSMLYLFDNDNLGYILAFLNSKVAAHLLQITSQTLDFKPGRISELPIILESKCEIAEIVEKNIFFSRLDWDHFETSWDFRRHPLLEFSETSISGCKEHKPKNLVSSAFAAWRLHTNKLFTQLKANEEDLNRIFINTYGLHYELTPEVEEKDVTISKADLGRDIRSFLSYAVGCMFGRYSLDVEGLAYAGGAWDATKYNTFIPVKDNIIPITGEEYFEEDIVILVCAFLRKTFGDATLEENLNFIAEALGNRGSTSREVIRNYFLKDFFKDHCKVYQKRPIYWLFDSGKADGFKALVYMHRYNADTIGNLRIDYLHKIQRAYESEIAHMQDIVDSSSNAREVAAAEKRKEKLIKQLKETQVYDEKIAHLALARIDIDLDDGVKVNYEKVQADRSGQSLQVLAKI